MYQPSCITQGIWGFQPSSVISFLFGSHVKSWGAKDVLGNTKNILHLLSYLDIEMVQVVEILPHERQGPVYLTCSVTWLLETWQCKELGHQHPWYWYSLKRFNIPVSGIKGFMKIKCKVVDQEAVDFVIHTFEYLQFLENSLLLAQCSPALVSMR